MILDLRRTTAGLVFALILALASLLALAAARELTPKDEPRLEKIRAALVANAEAALARQGGSRILLQVDTDALHEAILIELRDDVRRTLRQERIPFAGFAARDGNIEVRIREAKDRERALSKLAPLAGATPTSARSVDVADVGEGLIKLTPTDSGFYASRRSTLSSNASPAPESRRPVCSATGSTAFASCCRASRTPNG